MPRIFKKCLIHVLFFLTFVNIGLANDIDYEQMSIEELKKKLEATAILADKYTCLYHLTSKYTRVDLDSAEVFGNQYLEMATVNKDNNEIAKASLRIGTVYMRKGQYDNGYKMLHDALDWFESASDKKNAVKCLMNISSGHLLEKKYNEALPKLFRTLELSKSLRPIDTMSIIGLHTNTAATLRRVRKFDAALDQLQKAREYLKLVDVPRIDAKVLMNEAAILVNQNKVEEAIPKTLKAIQIADKSNDFVSKAIYMKNLGQFYQTLNRYDDAIKTFNESLDLMGKSGNEYKQWGNYFPLAECYYSIGKIDLAYEAALKAKRLAPSSFEYSDRSSSNYKLLAKIDSIKGNYQLSLQHYKKYATLRDSVKMTKYNTEIEKITSRYELKEKEKEISTLKEQELIQSIAIAKSQRDKSLLALGSFFLLAIGSFYFYRNRNNLKAKTLIQQKNNILEEKESLLLSSLKEKEILLKEIHHRVKNNLQLVISLITLQADDLKGETIEEFLYVGQNRVKSIALIHEQLYRTENLSFIEFDVYVQQLLDEIFRSYGLPDISYELDVQKIQLDIEKAIPLGLIINELVTNALNHAFNDKPSGKLSIFLKDEKEKIHLEVRDDGSGYETNNQKNTSMGLNLVQLLVQQLRGTFDVKKIDGTRVNIFFQKTPSIY